MKIFCLSIYNENYKLFKELNLIPVGLGNENFKDGWLNDKGTFNISEKNSFLSFWKLCFPVFAENPNLFFYFPYNVNYKYYNYKSLY